MIKTRFDSRLPGLYLALGGSALTILGFLVERKNTEMAWRSGLGLKIVPVSLALLGLYVAFTFFAFRQGEVQITNGDVVLAGTLLIPRGEGPHPALAMLPGAGESTRMGTVSYAPRGRHNGCVIPASSEDESEAS